MVKERPCSVMDAGLIYNYTKITFNSKRLLFFVNSYAIMSSVTKKETSYQLTSFLVAYKINSFGFRKATNFLNLARTSPHDVNAVTSY